MKRLVRFAFLASLVAAAVSAVRAMRREQDPLPAPPTGTGAGPWPPLQNPSPAPPEPASAPEKTTAEQTTPKKATPKKAAPKKATPRKAAPKKAASPAPAPHDRDTPNGSVSPEPGGIPVGDRDTGPAGRPWVEPTSEGECPDGYPIKAKLSSKIFHAPGQLNYDRTTPDRCYASTEAAEADGLRAAKR